MCQIYDAPKPSEFASAGVHTIFVFHAADSQIARRWMDDERVLDWSGRVPVWVENGGESVQAPVQKGDPDRRAGVTGPGGNTWWFSTQLAG